MVRFARVARLVCSIAFVALALATVSPSSARADARSDYLVRLLSGSSQFRVRAQAAISLGNATAESEVLAALSLALKDEHPAVRAAAATSLGRLGDARALDALRGAAGDAEAPVQVAVRGAIAKLEGSARMSGVTTPTPAGPRGPPRFYLAVGRPGTRAEGISPSVLDQAHQSMQAYVSNLDGVVLAPQGEASAAAAAVLRSRKLKGFYIDSSITSLQEQPGGGVRAAVSVVVQTYPGRDARAMLNGAATVMGGGDVRDQAVERAFQSTLRGLPQAMAMSSQ